MKRAARTLNVSWFIYDSSFWLEILFFLFYFLVVFFFSFNFFFFFVLGNSGSRSKRIINRSKTTAAAAKRSERNDWPFDCCAVRAEVRTVRIFNSTKTKQKIKKQTNRKNRKWKKKRICEFNCLLDNWALLSRHRQQVKIIMQNKRCAFKGTKAAFSIKLAGTLSLIRFLLFLSFLWSIASSRVMTWRVETVLIPFCLLR